MTDNEIIKALECCGIRDTKCISCPYYEKTYCVDVDALDLINRQKAEIDILIRKKESLRDEIAEQQAEIERLKEENKQIRNDCRWCEEWQTTELLGERAKAIKEFVERLKEKADSGFWQEHSYVSTDDIDDLVKEMTEQKNDFKE